jgi:predicted O-methyltransferase YrrM
VDHNNILEKLTTNLKNHNVTDMVTIIRKTSDEATAPDNIDFLHVDGNHMDQSIKDVQKYAPKIPIGGIVMCDDLHWATGCVLRAVDALEEMGFVEAFRCEDWNVMQRVK